MTTASIPERRERHLENSDRLATAQRFVRALGRHVGDQDVDHLAYFTELARTVDEATAMAVRGLRDQGYSWDAIALGLGVSRQYAWRTYRDLDEMPTSRACAGPRGHARCAGCACSCHEA